MNLPETNRWFALQVRTRWERRTAEILGSKGYQVLVPMTNGGRRVFRGSASAQPLFPGYLFCRFDVQERLPVLVTPGVIAVVGRGRVPVAVEESELAAIQALMGSEVPCKPWPFLEVGQRVRIEETALRGVEGILLNVKGVDRVIISVSLLCRSVALEIDRAKVTPIDVPQRDCRELLMLAC